MTAAGQPAPVAKNLFTPVEARGMRDALAAAPFRSKEFDLALNRARRLPVLEGKHCAVAAPVGAV